MDDEIVSLLLQTLRYRRQLCELMLAMYRIELTELMRALADRDVTSRDSERMGDLAARIADIANLGNLTPVRKDALLLMERSTTALCSRRDLRAMVSAGMQLIDRMVAMEKQRARVSDSTAC